jgi:phosphate transport system permease protein
VSAADSFAPSLRWRKAKARAFAVACGLAAAAGVAVLATLLVDVARDGLGHVDWQFLTSFPSRSADKAGIRAALWGTVWLLGLTALISFPLGIGAAVYLEEYAPKNRWTRFLEINIANLAGVPSIVYGILGLALFVRGIGFGPSLLAGALTMSLLILPVVIISSREALRAVPQSIRLAALAVGATRWQTTRHHALPAALPGILTGIILSMSRAIGESAPMVMMGALTYVAFVPKTPLDRFTVLPIQVFNWSSRPQPAFQEVAAAGIIVLLAVLLTMNATAILIRNRFQRFRR